MTVFVILHYLSQEMTEECISKIEEKIDKSDNRIVIVDNASSNGSGLRLKEKYKDDSFCKVILNGENLGFANGNNVGYQYAKEHYNPDFIVIMNNDVLIEDAEFIEKIQRIYNETRFDVLGPDILAIKTGVHQNPMKIKPYSKAELEEIVAERKKWLSNYKIHYILQYGKSKLRDSIKKVIHWKSKSPEQLNALYKNRQIEHPVLHGACLIFSERFIQNEDVAFNPGTFLYMEEDILHYTCRKKKYNLLYDSSVSVHHLEDVSTNLEFKSDYEKRRMKYRNLINSINVLLQLMNEDESI